MNICDYKKKQIKALKPNSDGFIKIHDVLEVRRRDEGVVLTRYFEMNRTPKSWAIEGYKPVKDWGRVDEVLACLRNDIEDEREAIESRFGVEHPSLFGRKFLTGGNGLVEAKRGQWQQ